MSSVTAKTLDELAVRLDKLAQTATQIAKDLGADASKISTSASFQKRLVVENKQFSLANSLESRGIGILVHKDKKKGSASINTTDEGSVRQAVEGAMALAKYSVPDEHLILATKEEATPAKTHAFQFDDELADTTLEELQGVMAEILASLVADKRVALDRFEMSIDVSWHGLRNSLGMHQTERQTMASWSFFGMGRDGEQVTGFDYDGSFSFDAKTMLEKGMVDAQRFVKKILGQLNPRQCPSYKGPVLLSPRAFQEIVLGNVLYHAGGRQVMDGKSRWDKSVGESVMSDKITIMDDPHDPRFSGATSFDSDGLPTRKTSIIDKGVLKLHLHDLYSAKRTGGGARASHTAGGPFAMQIAPGTSKLADMMRAADNLLLVDRFSGNDDPVKGDFSGVAKSSRLLVKGQDTGSVTETMIAGNFFDLARAVLAVSAEVENVSGSFSAPYVLVDGVSVTGE